MCVRDDKGCSSFPFFFSPPPQFERAVAHLHYERRPGSLVGSPRGALERPGPAGVEKSPLTHDTATCVEADEEGDEEGGGGGRRLGRMKTGRENNVICAVLDSSSIYWTDVVCKCVFQAFPGTWKGFLSSCLQLEPRNSLTAST